MTNIKNTVPQNNQLYIPSREEFHREYAGTISEADFNTCHPNPHRLDAQYGAYKFNQQLMATICRRKFLQELY